MKEKITVYYFKDRKHPNDYIVKRILTQENEYYSIVSYFMINEKLKEFPSKLKMTSEQVNKYIIECMKADFFNKIEYQNIMEGI